MNDEKIKRAIIQKAIEVIKERPEGIKSGQLVQRLKMELPGVNEGTIYWTIVHMDAEVPEEVFKPGKGRFRHVSYKDLYEKSEAGGTAVSRISEENFYKPFAEWLVAEHECTKAKELGKVIGAPSWGNPDVVGINEPKDKWRLKPPIEIVTAEIKSGGSWKELIIAFGQACSYTLFSHKTYIVVPDDSDGLDKIDALSVGLGIGLITFKNNNLENPDFEVWTRAYKHEPDMDYLNEFVERERIRKLLFETKPE